MFRVGAVIVCAGKGERTGLTYNKILYKIGRKTVLETVLDKFSSTRVERIVLVISEADRAVVSELISPYSNVYLCVGGDTRSQSVYNGLSALSDCDIVVIHDGARPFVTTELIDESIASAIEYGSGIAAVPVTDTVKRVSDGEVTTLPRDELYAVQTPQTFIYKDIFDAYNSVGVDGVFTDDAAVYEKCGLTPRLIRGSYDNKKITTPNDLISALPVGVKLGIGFDVHRLVDGRKLILGGVEIAHSKGLLGHSDADVLTHAVMDALLSAAGLPDIGVLYPDTDPKYLGISSMSLLDDTVKRIKELRLGITGISVVVIAQQPKLAPHISNIRKSLADRMGISIDKINVSASTAEKLGAIGSGDAIEVNAACLLTENYEEA